MNPKGKAIVYLLYAMTIFFLFTCQSTAETLSGAAFTKPAMSQVMPPAWQEKPIKYAEKHGKVDLVVSLDRQFMQFAPFIKKFGLKNKLKIQIKKGTCGTSLDSLLKKNADITGYCCAPGKIDRLPGVIFHTIAIHPISILVNKDNPITGLALEQVREIFMGDIGRWSEVGGRDIPILPVIRLHCAKRPGHWRLILDNADLFSSAARPVASIEDMFSVVGSNPGAFGYEVMWQSLQHKNIRGLNIDGIAPENLQALVTGRYKIYRVLNLTSWEGEKVTNPLAQELIDYLRTMFKNNAAKLGVVDAATLKKNGWKFKGDELIGTP